MIQGLFDLAKRKALVTGGAVGVGRACATALAMAGVDVAIIGRTRRTAEKTCDSLKAFGVDAFFVQCDVSSPEQVEDMMAVVVQRFGRIDIAVNNAGGSPSDSAISLSRKDWDRTIGVNLSGVFWCAQAQARLMSKQSPVGGKIINIASMYASVAGGNCAYNASKAAVVHLTKSLAGEWGSVNINVNCISPGWMLTPGNRVEPKLRKRMREVTPMGSLVRYQDMYGAVIYLSSAASDCVTGQELTIDGGHTVNTWLDPLVRSVPARTRPDEEEIDMNCDLAKF
jgi:NAD(P)-dependent dehydrogenase (short-subunit alcohol dehydrogenase family)